MSSQENKNNEPYAEQDFDDADGWIRKKQFFTRRPKKANYLLSQLMARKGYNQQQASGELDEAWNRIAADKWRDQTRTGNISRGVLEIVVTTSVLNHQLEFDKKRLLKELNQQLPQANIKDIRFRIGNV